MTIDPKRTILVVEDEPAIAETVEYALKRAGFSPIVAGDLASGRLHIGNADLIVLDLMLPDGSGLELIREHSQGTQSAPIIVLSSRDSEEDRVSALESGADDYVTKPFSPREVVARVRAVLRRLGDDASTSAQVPLRCEAHSRRAWCADARLELTRVEFDLLAALLKIPGQVYGRSELINEVWGDGFAITDRTIDSHIKSLRRKVSEAGGRVQWIETVRGVGYRVTDGTH